MRGKIVVPLSILVAAMVWVAGDLIPQGADSSTTVKLLFPNPPRAYSSAPFWVWNDLITEDQVIDTLQSFAAQSIKQVIVHPRPGLMTPYLSADWFRLWKLALNQAERLDMDLWIYDENSYPSGFAGGFVPDAMPEARGRGLALRETSGVPKWKPENVAVYLLKDQSYEDVSARLRGGETLSEGRYLEAGVARSQPGAWYGGKTYVDLLYPGVTAKFLSVTLDAYKQQIGGQFGKRIPGVFTDEPHLRPAGGLPWTDDLAQAFETRWGYRLTDHLPALRDPVGDWRRVRHNYFQLLSELFVERWGRPYYEYCVTNRLEFTGHYWEHEWPNTLGVPNNMAMSAWQQRPGIDILMNQYAEDTHAQFGNVRAVKELSSVANQLGRTRTLCEAYGAGGWDLRFEDMKRIGDWLYVLGVNTLNEHLSYVSLRGARKRDHPQSFSYHEPWWDAYHVSAEYFSRLALVLTKGEELNPVLVIEPTTTAWMFNTSAKNPPELDRLGAAFQKLVAALSREQVEYDIGDEEIMASAGLAVGKTLRVGERAYSTVVIPPHTENLNKKTVDLLDAFLANGGTVLSCSPPPARVEGQASERAAAFAGRSGWKQVEADSVPAQLAAAAEGVRIRRAAGDKGILFHQRRKLVDGEFLFLVNTSIDAPAAGTIESRGRGIERWLAETGKIEAYPYEESTSGVRARFQIPPSGSLLLFISNQRRTSAAVTAERTTPLASGTPTARRIGPNVLTLDYVDAAAGGRSMESAYFYQASQFVFKQNGLDRNPWDSAVQFKDEIITRKFPAQSGFQATYRFTIAERVPANLFAVVERPDLYTIECNGKPVQAPAGSWWLDKAFGKIPIGKEAIVGDNTLVLKATPFTIFHELEPAYILGDFALQPAEKGFALVPETGIRFGAWNTQGYPFYAEGVSYQQSFRIDKVAGQYRVALPKWYGSVARVIVNKKPAGYVTAPPWQCDVTAFLKPGENGIEVTVVGTLKNTLGPHHGKPALGSAWPASFQNGPASGPPNGAQYATVGYGLMEPFQLIQTVR
jgi:hypothetical protein